MDRCLKMAWVTGLCWIIACNPQNEQTEMMGNISAGQEENFLQNKVTVYTTVSTDFEQQIVTNGKLEARTMISLKFPSNEKIMRITVKNGQIVHKNEVLAELDKVTLQRKLLRGKEAYERATIALDDKLIDHGYRLADSAKVPANLLKMAKIKSNYVSSWLDLEEIKQELEQSVIVAPVDGTIADMTAKPGNYPEVYSYKFATLVANSEMLVNFTLLESDISYIREGMSVVIHTYGEKTTTVNGRLYTINPLVDKDGLINAQAVVSNKNNILLSGMNVKVSIINKIPDKITIPKDAVLQKQDGKVVFIIENGVARWNYVETGPTNEKSVVITSGLKPGQKVITSNPELLTNGASISVE